MPHRVAIIGTTGTNAKPWTDAFLAAGWQVRSLVRNPAAVAPKPGQSVATFDLDHRDSFAPALADIEVLGLVTPADPLQVERETALIEAARRAGVARVIKLSVIGAEMAAPISPFARWSARVDAALAGSGLPYVLLRANGFMQNLLRQRDAIAAGTFVEPTGDRAAAYIDVRDIADVAVAVAGGGFDGRALHLTGAAALTGTEIASCLSVATGKPVRFVSPDLEAFRGALAQRAPAWQVDALMEVYTAMAGGRAPHLAIVSPDVTSVLGRPPRSFLQFARDTFSVS